VTKDYLESLASRDQSVFRANKGLPGSLVRLGPSELRELQVLLAHRANKDPLESSVLTGPLERPVRRVTRDHLEPQVRLVPRVIRALRESLAQPVPLVHRVKLVPQVPRAIRESLV